MPGGRWKRACVCVGGGGQMTPQIHTVEREAGQGCRREERGVRVATTTAAFAFPLSILILQTYNHNGNSKLGVGL